MSPQRNTITSITIYLSIFCLGIAANTYTEAKQSTTVQPPVVAMREIEKRIEEMPVDIYGTRNSDVVTKRFKFPPCALPKSGPFFCYGICLLLLNDHGECSPGNICACSIKVDRSPGWLFNLLG